MPIDRIPAERLRIGDIVQAVAHGPQGKVTRIDSNWTLVQYHDRHSGGTAAYEHGLRRLILVRCAR